LEDGEGDWRKKRGCIEDRGRVHTGLRAGAWSIEEGV